MQKEKSENGPQVLQRALKLFEVLAGSAGITAIDIGRELGVTRQTVYSLLVPLMENNYVEKDEESGKFRMGYRFYELGKQYRHFYKFGPTAEIHAKKLSRLSGLQSNVGVFKTPDKVLMIISADMMDDSRPQVEAVISAHCSSCGKVLLAWMDEESREMLLNGLDYVRYTQNTICDRDTLSRELEEIRRKGYAVERGELFSSKGCVGAPVRGADGKVIAAISVYGSCDYVIAHEDELAKLVLSEAADTSMELGFRPLT